MIELCHCEQSDFVRKRKGRPKLKREAKKTSSSSSKYCINNTDYPTVNQFQVLVEMRGLM